MKKIITLIGLLPIIGFVACHSKEHKTEHIETKYTVTSPVQRDTNTIKDYVSQIKSIRHIEIRSQEKGYLQEIYVDEGQFVKKGQLLFQIMPNLYNAELKIVQSEAEIAKIEYLNTKALADSNIVSNNELLMAKAKLNKANAQVDLAKVHVDFTEIRAPFDGIVDLFEVKLGSLVDEGDLLTNLADNSEMWIYFNVPEAEYLNLETTISKDSALTVQLRMANNKLFEYSGSLETIEADFNNETGNIAFRATFPNPKGLLRHGETGNILMQVPYINAVIIPQKATFEILDKKYVYVVSEDDSVHAREVVIGAELEDLYIISNGLKVDEKILLEGIRKVHEDDVIKYEYEVPETVMSHLKLYAE